MADERVDLEVCRQLLRHGSKSFAVAARLLPRRLRDPVTAFYAFCRVADDLVDDTSDPAWAVKVMHHRVRRIYAGDPFEHPVDRAFARVVHRYHIPQAPVMALLEGFAWDANGRRYDTLAELEGYCARVASAVGVVMTYVMGVRDPKVLARACDLGLAMQLTNISRDVGEDLRAGRLYLPATWLREAQLDATELQTQPRHSPALARIVERLLSAADRYYARADIGIAALPRDCRVAIRAARLIYADIGRVIRQRGFDAVTQRAHTGSLRKLWLALRSLGAWLWTPRPNLEPPAPAAGFLVPRSERP